MAKIKDGTLIKDEFATLDAWCIDPWELGPDDLDYLIENLQEILGNYETFEAKWYTAEHYLHNAIDAGNVLYGWEEYSFDY